MSNYPRYPEELDGRKKLLSNDIDKMILLRNKGLTYKEIALIFNVTSSTVGYHLNEETKNNVKRLATIASYNRSKEERTAQRRKAKIRKRELMLKEISLYNKSIDKRTCHNKLLTNKN